MPYSHKRSPEKRKARRLKYLNFEQKMKQKDTARAIIKDLNPRDPVTGEIIYDKANESKVKTELLTGKYCVEKEKRFDSPYVKNKPEKQWLDIDPEIFDDFSFAQGEVLNRSSEPCWWR